MLPSYSFDILGTLGRTMSDMTSMSSMVEGGLSNMGYIPVMEAVKKCEGQARWRVEKEIDRWVICFLQNHIKVTSSG